MTTWGRGVTEKRAQRDRPVVPSHCMGLARGPITLQVPSHCGPIALQGAGAYACLVQHGAGAYLVLQGAWPYLVLQGAVATWSTWTYKALGHTACLIQHTACLIQHTAWPA